MVAAVKGRPGLVLLALLLALVFWRVTDPGPGPDPKLAAVRAVQLTDADTKVPEPTPTPVPSSEPSGCCPTVSPTSVEPAPAGGLRGYNDKDYAADNLTSSVVRIPLYSTKDDPVPDTAWDAQMAGIVSEIGKTNLPLPGGQERKEFMQFRMRDVCNKKNRWMIPVNEKKSHEDA